MEFSYSYKRYAGLLKERGCSSAQVCKETGIKENVISNWRNRGGDLSFENMVRVAKFFNVPVEYFSK